MPLAARTRIGTFEILGLLGSGGMGEVYRARDAKLGRDVALKILPSAVAADPERLARFRREARLLASLNHPHIGGIYGFEDESGIHALVLELVEGETLADRIAAGPLAVKDALAIARQIAHALDAAHEAGIVHRDLKPANIKVRADGTVKILDFGLAKALDADATPADAQASTMTSAGSRSGLILGTPAYMSPEQARGQTIGKRTDIWAFGCVLYEMLTGRRAFDGSTVSDTLVSILSKDPDWSALPASTPGHVRRLIARCLERDPTRRLRDIGDALPELGATVEAGDPAVRRRRTLWVPWLVTAAAVVAAAALALTNRGSTSASPSLADARLERLTYDAGLTTTPSVSPDGNFVAYASDRAGKGDLDIWLQRATGGEPLRLTDDPADDGTPDFSPDGSQVLFRSERDGGGAYIVPALGGPARLLVADARDPRFSPDGTRVAYWTGQFRGVAPQSEAYVMGLAGGTAVRLLPDFFTARYPVWSPDGKALLIVGRPRGAPVAELDWWWVPLDERKPQKTGVFPMLKADPGSGRADWTPEGVVFAPGGDLWRVRISGDGRATAPAERMTAGAGAAQAPSVSRDGTVVFAAVERQRAIVRAAIGTADPPLVLYADDRSDTRRASVTADGGVIVFERWYSAHTEIWLKDLRNGQQRLIARVDDAGMVNAAISADGRRLVYTVRGDARPGTGYVVDVGGGTPRKICDQCDLWGGFLSDGQRTFSVTGGRVELIDTRDGARVEVLRTSNGVFSRPHLSPDDRWLAFRHEVGADAKSFVVPFRPGRVPARETWQPVDEPTTTGRPTGWSLDSRTLYLLLDTDGFRCVWAQRIDPATGRLVGTPSIARHVHEPGMSTSAGNPIVPQGVVYERANITANVWRILRSSTR